MNDARFDQECPALDNIIKCQIPELEQIPRVDSTFTLPPMVDRLGIFRQIERIANEVDSRYEQANALFRSILSEANGFDTFFVPVKVPHRVVASAELAILPVDEIGSRLTRAAEIAARETVSAIVTACRENAVWQRIGLIRWLAVDVCRYFYFRRRIERRQIGRDYLARSTRTDYEELTIHGIFIRDVIDAKTTPAKKYKGSVPQRIRKVINNIPPWIEPLVQVVSGHQIAATTVEREVGRKVWSEFTPNPKPIVRLDPCLIIGPFVLCGWDEGER